MGKVRTFRDLVAWQKGMELAQAVYRLTAAMPEDERFWLTSQTRRAAVSIPANIAEGFGRQTRSDYLRHLRISRASLAELFTQIDLIFMMKMLPPQNDIEELLAEEDRILQGLIRSLEQKDRQPNTP